MGKQWCFGLGRVMIDETDRRIAAPVDTIIRRGGIESEAPPRRYLPGKISSTKGPSIMRYFRVEAATELHSCIIIWGFGSKRVDQRAA